MFEQEKRFSITNKTNDKLARTITRLGRLPSLPARTSRFGTGGPFVKMKEKILGKSYSLSLNFVGVKKIKTLNSKYRKIDRPTDILSFPLSKKDGEIFICPKIANIKAVEFQRSQKNFFAFLFIHGLTHLLGHDHSRKMEAVENKYRKYFHI